MIFLQDLEERLVIGRWCARLLFAWGVSQFSLRKWAFIWLAWFAPSLFLFTLSTNAIIKGVNAKEKVIMIAQFLWKKVLEVLSSPPAWSELLTELVKAEWFGRLAKGVLDEFAWGTKIQPFLTQNQRLKARLLKRRKSLYIGPSLLARQITPETKLSLPN